ncbi:MAG: HAMP domain-containing protein [Chromatiales bacterium]|nr:HAMP domain-containing protein [Chromatiales bacterium]
MWFRTLKFQIGLALALVLAISAGASSYTLYAIDARRSDDVILNLAARLQLTAQRLTRQAMLYKENAPRDYDTYYRDVRLYYQDLNDHVMTIDQISRAFVSGEFPDALTGLGDMMRPILDPATKAAVEKVRSTWAAFREGLFERIGDDKAEPRLEWAAEYIEQNAMQLDVVTESLFMNYQVQSQRHIGHLNLVNRGVMLLTLLVTLGTALWFVVKVLRPLDRAVDGFRRVARGGFGHEIEVRDRNEIGWLTKTFNDASRRVQVLFRLIDTIQQDSDLDHTLEVVYREIRSILPLDWVGALYRPADGSPLELQRAYGDGLRDDDAAPHLRTETDPAWNGGAVHIDDLPGAALHAPDVALLGYLADQGLNSAIVLPLDDHHGAPGLLVFASREAGAYGEEHLELFHNIGTLVAHSFSNTLRLIDQARLAAIGEFSSGIVHEIRNPLATISLALQYLERADLSGSARKRSSLAVKEAQRMERLLEDILLYAKPLVLQRRDVSLIALLESLVAANQELAASRGAALRLEPPLRAITVHVDPDRLQQALLNLTRNACEASVPGTQAVWSVKTDYRQGRLCLYIQNQGEPIPAEIRDRLWKPFASGKVGGTGLGLPIAKRMVEAHGGQLSLLPDSPSGTTFEITLPLETISI